MAENRAGRTGRLQPLGGKHAGNKARIRMGPGNDGRRIGGMQWRSPGTDAWKADFPKTADAGRSAGKEQDCRCVRPESDETSGDGPERKRVSSGSGAAVPVVRGFTGRDAEDDYDKCSVRANVQEDGRDREAGETAEELRAKAVGVVVLLDVDDFLRGRDGFDGNVAVAAFL